MPRNSITSRSGPTSTRHHAIIAETDETTLEITDLPELQPDENNLNANTQEIDTTPTTAPPNHTNHETTEAPTNPPALAEALTLLANSIGSSAKAPSQPKVREPDTFDGSNPRKLQPFLVQCYLNFRDRPDSFDTDMSKVTFVLSYLTGTALDWFEPALQDLSEDPSWLTDFDEFTAELKANFGPFDPEGEAEHGLENLRMKDYHHANRYLVEFNRLASRVAWNDAALRRQLYRGLPPRIKDEISRIGKPETLQALQTMVQNIEHVSGNARANNSANSPSRLTKSLRRPLLSSFPDDPTFPTTALLPRLTQITADQTLRRSTRLIKPNRLHSLRVLSLRISVDPTSPSIVKPRRPPTNSVKTVN